MNNPEKHETLEPIRALVDALMESGDINPVKEFLATLPDDAARRDALLKCVSTVEDGLLAGSRDLAPDAYEDLRSDIDRYHRDNPESPLGALTELLETYKQ